MTKILIRYVVSFLLCAVLIAQPGFARAQNFVEAYKKPLPTITLAPQKDFEGKTTLYQETPSSDKRLNYEIRLPKNWSKTTLAALSDNSINSKILTEMGRFYGPQNDNGARAYISIKVADLEHKQTAQQWLIQHFVASAYTPQGMKIYDDARAEALYVHVEQDAQYLTRIVTQLNGKRVLILEYFLPTDNWSDEKQIQAQIAQSFKVMTPVTEDVEPMAQYHFLDTAHFTYPQSWQLRADSGQSAERMQARILNIEKSDAQSKFTALNGQITVVALSSSSVDSVDKEISDFKNDLQKAGLLIQTPLETRKDFKVTQGLDSRPVEVFSALDRQNDGLKNEFWFEVLESDDAYFFVTLTTPSRDQDYFTWARNTETYESLIESLGPGAAAPAH